ncbi:MAG: S8 family serine peptidase [Bacillus sp. (in: firmicutes)]
MNKNIVIILLCLCLFPSEPHAHDFVLPPKPKRNQAERTIAIVMIQEQSMYEDVLEKTEAFPGVTVRREFKETLNGFSIEGERGQISKLKQTLPIQYISETKTYNVHLEKSVPFIGAQEVRGFFDPQNRRLTGKGVKVGVIDTGIDYHHQDLTRVFKGGKDLVDLDDDPMETTGSGSEATIHGTHVAGIIAANGNIQGVAPEVDLYAYRALGPGGSGDTETVIAAIEQAVKDKMDIVNLSLGNNINGPDLPITLALNKAIEKGITAIVSNGNAGPKTWTVGSPGTSEKAISVGASLPPVRLPYLQVGLGSLGKRIPLHQLYGAEKWEFLLSETIVDGGKGAKQELNDVSGKIALIERGRLSIDDKITNAIVSGARAVLIYNNGEGAFLPAINKKMPIPVAVLTKKDGSAIKEILKNQKEVPVKTRFVEREDYLASFSSRGPVTVSWEIKPDLLAPGMAINSTVPGGYLSLQGTSMAAPHVTGAAALLKQAHPEWTPEQIKSALMSTAKLLTDEQGEYYRTYEQGAGRIQIQEAVQADTFFYPSSLTFGLYERKNGEAQHHKQIIIENSSEQEKYYSFLIPQDEHGLNWKVPKSFTLKPKQKKMVEIGLSINTSKFKKGLYDGFIQLKEGNKLLHMPYLYLKDEPDFPKMMGFQLTEGDAEDTYRYEMYIPAGGDELTIALYDYDTFTFAGFLEHSSPAPAGFVQKEINKADLPVKGTYVVIIQIIKGGVSEEFQEVTQIY